MAPGLPDDFREFLSLLSDEQVRYLLIGGYAVGYHGYPRATGDLDVWIEVDPDNADRMVAVLRRFGFLDTSLSAELFLRVPGIIRMGVPPMRIEVLTDIDGVAFSDCYAERLTDDWDGVEVNLISLDRLRQNKRAAGRFKDLDDLENLPRS